MTGSQPIIDDALVTLLDLVGETVAYDQGGNVQSILGLFGKDSQRIDGRQNAILVSSAPRLTIRVADLAQAPQKAVDQVTVRGIQYKVVTVNLDGEGGAELILKEVTP